MKTEWLTVPLSDGDMQAYVAWPEGEIKGAIVAIMEIWGVNDTMRHHAHEYAEAGFVCLVPTSFGGRSPEFNYRTQTPITYQKLSIYITGLTTTTASKTWEKPLTFCVIFRGDKKLGP